MVCLDYGMGQCKPPTWSKVGMEITPGELNKVFLAKEGVSSVHSLGSGLDLTLFYLGLTFVIAMVIYLWISKRMKQQVSYFVYITFSFLTEIKSRYCILQMHLISVCFLKRDSDGEKLPENKKLYEKILVRMGKVEERIESLEEFVQRLSKRAKPRKMGDQKDSD